MITINSVFRIDFELRTKARCINKNPKTVDISSACNKKFNKQQASLDRLLPIKCQSVLMHCIESNRGVNSRRGKHILAAVVRCRIKIDKWPGSEKKSEKSGAGEMLCAFPIAPPIRQIENLEKLKAKECA